MINPDFADSTQPTREFNIIKLLIRGKQALVYPKMNIISISL